MNTEGRPAYADRLAGWLARTADLAADHDLHHVAVELRELVRRDGAPPRAAVLGQPSVGKSRLVNELLGVTAVAESAVSRRTRPIVIRAAAAPAGELPSIEDALGADAPAPARDVVELEHPWLRSTGLEIVETPGMGGGPEHVDAASRRTARHSDIAVVVVRARGGMTVPERDLLGELAGAPSVGAVLLLVSMLDELTGDRDQVMARVRALARRIDPRIEVLPAGPDPGAELRARLGELAGALSDPVARSIRLLKTLVGACAALEAHASERLRDHAGAAAERAEALRRIELQRRAADARWAVVEVELDRRRSELRRRVLARCEQARGRVLDAAETRLADAEDLRAAWRDGVLPELEDGLSNAAREVTELAVAEFTDAAERVDAELAEVTGPLPRDELREVVARADSGGRGVLDPRPRVEALAAERPQALGAVVLDVCRGLLEVVIQALLPFGAAPEASGGLLDKGQAALRERLVNRRRAELLAAVRDAIDDFFRGLLDAVDEHAAPCYAELVERARRHHEAWWRARLDTWSDTAAPWARLHVEALRLKEEMQGRLVELTTGEHEGDAQ
ncbi:hypothetical protein Acsp04_46620 [Actinomadura sp. NBRC 104425]|uniref:GTPase n=1 Tax=Actinomadura sp. NBRC 104425 TaxID=3032204 RepID=UPI00249F9AFE|nr:GTPase [Actinomadura sp. NBRC 104425]GLZ14427.1 hypothetical protein Acsp04_46620 [Actinomadura sp. NBRC 104425]